MGWVVCALLPGHGGDGRFSPPPRCSRGVPGCGQGWGAAFRLELCPVPWCDRLGRSGGGRLFPVIVTRGLHRGVGGGGIQASQDHRNGREEAGKQFK